MKIALGTVQFGINYGVANTHGQVSQIEAKKILDYASKNGVDTIDTAIAYGTSEVCLGKIGVKKYKVITKLPEIPNDYGNLGGWVEYNVNRSLSTLGINTISALLLHRPSQLFDKDKKDLWSILVKLKNKGLVKKIGFSIYTPEELNNLCSIFKPDIVQAPYNIFDRRLEESGCLSWLSEENIEVHIRSIFLQGLLLMSQDIRPIKFNKWNNLWNDWESWLKDNNISPLQGALSFALSDERVSKVIVGVDSLNQWKDLIYASNNISEFPSSFHISDSKLLNPSEWSLF